MKCGSSMTFCILSYPPLLSSESNNSMIWTQAFPCLIDWIISPNHDTQAFNIPKPVRLHHRGEVQYNFENIHHNITSYDSGTQEILTMFQRPSWSHYITVYIYKLIQPKEIFQQLPVMCGKGEHGLGVSTNYGFWKCNQKGLHYFEKKTSVKKKTFSCLSGHEKGFLQ